jgi:glycosyltransferase 2 family protein
MWQILQFGWLTRTRVRLIAAVCTVIALVFAVRSLHTEWNAATASQVVWTPLWLPVVVIAALLAHLLMAGGWALLIIRSVPSIKPWTAIRLWFAGQLGRFLPTGLGSTPARIAVCNAAGIPTTVTISTTVAELVAAALTAAVAALLLLGEPLGLAALSCAVVVAAIGAMLVGHRTQIAGRAWLAFLCLHGAKLAVRAAGMLALLHMVDPANGVTLSRLLGSVGLAYLAGLAAFFAPGGIGVRETVLAAGLANAHLSAGVALACAVSWRVIELVAELALFVATQAMPVIGAARSRRDSHREGSATTPIAKRPASRTLAPTAPHSTGDGEQA